MIKKNHVEKRTTEPHPMRVMDLIDVQKDAIVSREILKCHGGSVTVFAFDHGQGLSEHTVPHEAAVHVLEGEFEISVAGKRLVVREGEMVLMPANKPHAVKATQSSKMILVMIKN